MKRKVRTFIIIFLASFYVGINHISADSAVNNYILNNNIAPEKEQINYRINMQDASKNGGINMNFSNGKPQLVIIHDVGVENSTIDNEINYMVRNQTSAFVHSFVDGSQLKTIADTSKIAWGAGPFGNRYADQIEQVRVNSKTEFAHQISSLANWTAQQMIKYQMGAPKLISTTSKSLDGNLASHENISYKWGGTDHVDPVEYWNKRGRNYFGQAYDMAQFRDLVTVYYARSQAPKITSATIVGDPSTGRFDVNVKTTGLAGETVKVPIWSDANGQDDIIWYSAEKIKNGQYIAHFNVNEHHNEMGRYHVRVYAYANNQTSEVAIANDNLNVNVSTNPNVNYNTQVQNIGWQTYVQNGQQSGTTGQQKRLEAIKMYITGGVSGGITYQTHVQDIGWQSSTSNDNVSGTVGQSKRLEAIRISLTGSLAQQYDVYYRVHAQNYGWLDWAKNGDSAGTAGMGLRLEAINIKLVKKGDSAPGSTSRPYVEAAPIIQYNSHVENSGWQSPVENGQQSGTTGSGLRLEGIKAAIKSSAISGGVSYQTHVQNIGWQNTVKDGQLSGTTGKSLRLEAIKMSLTGQLAQEYDIYYQVHAQNYGWLGWAKNGEVAGTTGLGYRLEAIKIQLVKKGTAFNAGGPSSVTEVTPQILKTSITGTPERGKFTVLVETNVSDLITVKIPVWTTKGGQDDIKWYNATNTGPGQYASDIDIVNHNNQTGQYQIHAYAYSLTKQTCQVVNNNLMVATKPILNGVNTNQLTWFNSIKSSLVDLANKNDIFPSVMLGQAITESSWGQSELAQKANNLFGIKATSDWKGDIYKVKTQEFSDKDQYVIDYTGQKIFVKKGQGYYIYANFRKYASQLDSLNDYVRKIRNNYAASLRSNSHTYQNAIFLLQKNGYATDPNYAKSMIARVQNYVLESLD
ncbi:GBS Bsp-like repeat-containing protein [Leuconostoc pseudomesenteroides]|uniref:GBS Bsp-like repeat-containing protein n=1 Tax=Leuconostoc pseudomesenteroides TaxID=33968 RepID=UPI0032DFD66B